MNKTEIKNTIQQEAVERCRGSDCLILNWFTGTGKTLAALKCVEDQIKLGNDKWYWVAHQNNHIDNAIADAKLFKKDYLFSDGYITAICYASIKKLEGKNVNVVYDEAHHMAAPSCLKYIPTISSNKQILLSATLETEIMLNIKPLFNKDIDRYIIDMNEAIKSGLVNKPTIYKVNVYLDNTKRNLIFKKTKGKEKIKSGEPRAKHSCTYEARFSKQKWLKDREIKRYELSIPVNEQEYYNLLSDEIKFYMRIMFRTPFFKQMMLIKSTERKRFVANCKTKYLKEIIKRIKGKRNVVFTGSIQQSKDVGGKNIVNSKNKDSQAIIEKFNGGKIDTLYAVQMLREAANLHDIEVGVITQLDNQELSFVQMLGRCFRSKNPEMYVLIMGNTQDENYFKTATRNVSDEYIVEITGDDLWN